MFPAATRVSLLARAMSQPRRAEHEIPGAGDGLDESKRGVGSGVHVLDRAELIRLPGVGHRDVLDAETLSLFGKKHRVQPGGQPRHFEVGEAVVAKVLDNLKRVDADRTGGAEQDQAA